MPLQRLHGSRRPSAPGHSFPRKHAASDGDVFATGLLNHADSFRQGTVLAHFGQLDQHGKIDPCQHVYLWTAHAGNSQVRRRAAEHVGENGNGAIHGECSNQWGTRLFILGTSPETDEDIAMLLFYLPIIIFEAMLEANANRREADKSTVIE